MKTKLIAICALTVIYSSCKQTDNKRQVVEPEKTVNLVDSAETIDFKSLLVNEITDTSKVFNVKDDGVYFIQMTTEESDSLEKADEEAYETLSENGNNASMSAAELLTNMKITQYWSDKRFVKFELDSKEYFFDTRKNENVKMGGCILFKKGTKPMIIDTELLTEEIVNEYYKK
jgi:uncharacterized protein (DUF2344 family)